VSKRHADFTTPHPGEESHVWDTPCFGYAKWCRIHRCPVWVEGELYHEYYPISTYIPTDKTYVKTDGSIGIIWDEIIVHCGPAAFYPPRGKRGK
jgi:hypothetical protein